jgi:ribosomal protein S18 acetylase RimI-like enzyme
MSLEKQHISIRLIQKEDEALLLSLAPRFNTGVPSWRNAEMVADFNQREVRKAITNPSTDSIVLIAEDIHGQPLGFINITDSTDYFTYEPQGYISALAITQEAEGKGVGRMLIAAGEDWARSRGYRFLTLDVFAQNERARALYQQLDYKEETLKLIKEL